jgi:UDP-2-acetamido-3-amino-2,3-dideoxy-glucuronate N-acetyltransferase
LNSINAHAAVRIHPTAIIEEGVSIGAGTSVWDNVHIRKNTVIGENCIIGEKTYIAYDVRIGNSVKINSFVYICTGVTIEDQVMISAGTIFSNDRFPRAFNADGYSIKTSNPTEETLETRVCRGVTIGAGCTIGPGIELGELCMIGMGSVVTRNVAPYQLVFGSPAKHRGFVCVCGEPLRKIDGEKQMAEVETSNISLEILCLKCYRKYSLSPDNCLTFMGRTDLSFRQRPEK